MNNWMNADGPWENESAFKVIRKTADLVEPPPARTWILIDEREDRINNGFFVVDMRGFNPSRPSSLQMVDYPASYHNRAAGLTFADGHAEIKRWLDPRTTPLIKKGANLPLISSAPFNRDVIWLQERTTGLVR